MTAATDIVSLSLRNAGITGVGQVALAQDTADAFTILNAWINELNLERTQKVNRVTLPTFPNQTTDVAFWTPYQHVLLTSMAVRLRQIYSLPPVELDVKIAALALDAFNSINLQQIAAPSIAANDTTGYGIIFLALRAAGRVTDGQGVAQTSQDVTDAASLMNEMLDEWQQQRTVRVIPGTIPSIPNLSVPLTLAPGMRNAIVTNLAVRLRDWFGTEVPPSLAKRADDALLLIQSINQQQVAPIHGGVPGTAQQLIFLALRMAGRITDTQSVSDTSKDVDDAFSLLVMMLGQWQRKRWLIWNEQEVSVVSTGANFYTIGPGPGTDFITARPDKIHAAWCRMQPFSGPNPVDIHLSIIEAKEDWAGITIKDLKSLPAAVFYDSSFPVGRVYFWPVPSAAHYEMHLVVKATLPIPATVTDTIALPPEYLDAVVNNLACRLIVANGGNISPFLMGQAKASLETIKLANSQIPLLSMPAALIRRRGDASSWVGQGLDGAWTVGGECALL